MDTCYQCDQPATEAMRAGEGFPDQDIPLCGRHSKLLREARRNRQQEPSRLQSNWHGAAGAAGNHEYERCTDCRKLLGEPTDGTFYLDGRPTGVPTFRGPLCLSCALAADPHHE